VPPIDFVSSHVIWHFKNPIYGIVSAPKSWFDRLIEVCRASGLTTATTDEGLLVMTSGEQVVGVQALHVDDAIGGGTKEFHGVMANTRETLAVGYHDTSNFRYKGLRVSTVFKDEQTVFEINVDGDDYLASCRTVDVPLGEDTDLLPPQSMTDYRSVVGTIGYASTEFHPDLAWETSSLSRQFVTPTISPVRPKEPSHPQVWTRCRQPNDVSRRFPRQFGRRQESRWSNRLFNEQDWTLGGLLDLLGI
jgi:hypothetical protein